MLIENDPIEMGYNTDKPVDDSLRTKRKGTPDFLSPWSVRYTA